MKLRAQKTEILNYLHIEVQYFSESNYIHLSLEGCCRNASKKHL